ncbi:Putative ribonuclease H protein At1g65750 [Linum perenne]
MQMQPPRGDGPDEQIWNYSKDGTYTVRSAYRWCCDRVDAGEDLRVEGQWRLVWELEVPPKMKHFVWKILRGILPTREALRRRGTIMPNECGCCSTEEENIVHFFECSVASKCWEEFGLLSLVRGAMANHANVTEALFHLIQPQYKSHHRLIVGTMWSLWRERNERVWNQYSKPENVIVKLGRDHIEEWWRLRQRGATGVGAGRDRGCTRWHPPAEGNVKINIDAALFGSERKFGVGLVARDNDGRLKGVRRELFAGLPPAHEAKARGLLEAIKWGQQMQWNRVVLETDCLRV